MAEPNHTIGTRTLRGIFWAYGSFVGGRVLSLLATAILARLVVPHDFGLIALAVTFMAFLDVFQGLGVSDALIISGSEDVQEKADTAFMVSVVMGFVLAVVTAALGPVAASFFHQPALVRVMPVLGVNFFLLGLSSTHYAMAQKALNFRARTGGELADVLARGLIGVLLALAGAGVWSLVVGYLVGTSALTIVLWRQVPWRPTFSVHRRHLRGLMRFGGSLTGVGVMAGFLNQFDNLVVGRVLGATALGFYSIASRLPYLLIVNLSVVAGQVLFPAFATLTRGDMARSYLTALRYTAAVALPLTAFLGILAEPITVGVFGPRWHPAVAAAQVLCVWALMSPASMVSGNAIKAHGRPDLIFKLAVPQAVALVIGSLLLVRQGIVAVSWLQAGIAVPAQIAAAVIAHRMFSVSWKSLLTSVGPPALAAVLLALDLIVVHHLISAAWPTIVVGALSGAIIYLGALVKLAPDIASRLRALAFPQPPAAEPLPPDIAIALKPDQPVGV